MSTPQQQSIHIALLRGSQKVALEGITLNPSMLPPDFREKGAVELSKANYSVLNKYPDKPELCSWSLGALLTLASSYSDYPLNQLQHHIQQFEKEFQPQNFELPDNFADHLAKLSFHHQDQARINPLIETMLITLSRKGAIWRPSIYPWEMLWIPSPLDELEISQSVVTNGQVYSLTGYKHDLLPERMNEPYIIESEAKMSLILEAWNKRTDDNAFLQPEQHALKVREIIHERNQSRMPISATNILSHSDEAGYFWGVPFDEVATNPSGLNYSLISHGLRIYSQRVTRLPSQSAFSAHRLVLRLARPLRA